MTVTEEASVITKQFLNLFHDLSNLKSSFFLGGYASQYLSSQNRDWPMHTSPYPSYTHTYTHTHARTCMETQEFNH